MENPDATHSARFLFYGLQSDICGIVVFYVYTQQGGRVHRTHIFIQEGNRLRSIPLSVVGSISQLIVTLVSGAVGLFYLKSTVLHTQGLPAFWLNGLLYAIIAALCYFSGYSFLRFPGLRFGLKKYLLYSSIVFFAKPGAVYFRQLTHILAFSVLRYAVFIIQYLVVFRLFNVDIPITEAAFAVSVLFLLLAVIPAVPNIAELGVRGEASGNCSEY